MILLFAIGLVLLRVLYSLAEIYFEHDLPRRTWRGLAISIGILLMCCSAFGQVAARVDVPLLTSGPNVPSGAGPLPQALWVSNSTAYICTHPSSTLGYCQSHPVTTYTDSTEGTTCPSDTPLVQLPGSSCTASTTVTANLGFWYVGGIVDYYIASSYGTFGPFTYNPPANAVAGNFVSSVSVSPQTMAGPLNTPGINGVLNAALYTGADIGAKVNAAYAALPSTGGEIYVPASATCYSYSTPIVFATNGKPVTLRGAGQPATCLSYTGTTGTAITLNTGVTENQPRLEDFSLIGSGVGNSTIGIQFGGSNSQETASWSRVKVEAFGLGVKYTGGGTFLVSGNEVIIKSNGQNFLDTTAQENLTFINSTFALDTPGTDGTTANSVEIQGGGDFHFIACSFDNVQLSVSSNATASIVGGHFENPATTSYNYFVFSGNTLNLTNVLFLQDNLSSFPNAQFGSATAGTVNVYGGQFFDPTSTAYFVGISGSPNVNIYGLNADSATPGFINGTTSGRIVQAPDSAGNFIIPDAVVAGGNVTATVNLVAVQDILEGPAQTLNNSMEQSFTTSSPGSTSNCAQWQLYGNANYFNFCGNGILTSPSMTTTTFRIGGNSVTALPASAIVGLTDTQALTNKTLSVPSARKGTFVCTGGGTISITNANYAATSDVIITMNTAGGTIGTPPAMKTVTPTTGFSVLCSGSDTSTYNYSILN